MNFLEMLRRFGFSGKAEEAGLWIRGFDSIPPELAAFKDDVRAAIGQDSYRVSPASSSRAPATFDDATRSVEAVLTTEQPVLMPDYARWEMVDEVLLMAGFKGIRGGRSSMPFLDSHNRFRADDVLGTTASLRIDGDALLGRNFFSSTEEKLYTKAREGHITDNSIGYRVHTATTIEPGQSAVIAGRTFTASQARALKVATSWEVHENSLTPIGADTRAGHRSLSPAPLPNPPPTRKENPMNDIELARALGAPASALTSEDTARAWIAQHKADQARAQRALLAEDIRNAFATHIDIPGVNERLEQQLALAREGKTDLGTARQALFDAMAAHSRSIHPKPGSGGSGFSGGNSGIDTLRAEMGAALLVANIRAAAPKYQFEADTLKKARSFGSTSSEHLARQLAQARGVDIAGMDRSDLFSAVFFGKETAAQRAAASDFKDITSSVARLSVKLGFESVPQTWTKYCRTSSLPDFESRTLRNFGAAMGEIPEVDELGEYTSGQETAKEEQLVKLKKHGKEFFISWETALADQLGFFSKVGFSMAADWARTLNRKPMKLLELNGGLGPKMGDNKTLFHADHGNLIVGAANNPITDVASSSLAIKALRLALRKQPAFGAKKEEDFADFTLATLLCGADAEENIFRALFEGGRADNNTDAFLRNQKIDLISDPALDVYLDPKNILGFSDLGIGSPLEMAFLEGNAAPRISTRDVQEKDAIAWRITGAAVCAASTWRGIAKSTGAA